MHRLPKPSPALIVSLVALFFALRLPERPLREEAHFTLGEALP